MTFDGDWPATTLTSSNDGPLGLSAAAAQLETRTLEENEKFVVDKIKKSYEQKIKLEESEAVAGLERYILLNAIDRLWQEHLYAMDGLREGIYLRSYGGGTDRLAFCNHRVGAIRRLSAARSFSLG